MQDDAEAAAVRHQGATTTYGQLKAMAEADAGRLRALGVDAGDRVILWLPNGPRWASLFFACARIGAVAVTAGTRLRPLDLLHIVRDAGASVLVYDPHFLGLDYDSMADEIERDLSGSSARTALVAVGCSSRAKRRSLDALPVESIPPPWANERAPAIVCYTSGTTGRPKGCVHSHEALVRNGTVASGLLKFGPEDRILCPVPFAHVFGFHMGVLQSALSGATLINAEPYDVDHLLHLAQEEKATVLYLVPSMAGEVVYEQRRRPRPLKDVRVTLVAGAPVPSQLREAILDPSLGLGGALSIVYGCSEAPTLTQLIPSDPEPFVRTSVGRATPGVQLRVVRPGSSTTLPAGEVGEIVTRGYNQMLGYLGDAAATQAKRRDGWLVTDDLGWFSDSGYLHVAGRRSEMFLVGGFNVYPRDVEAQLELCEGVADVAVIGVPDERLGSVAAAWVVASDASLTEEQVLEWSHRRLASYKRPRYVRVVRSLPRTGTGKLSRVKLESLARRALPNLNWDSELR